MFWQLRVQAVQESLGVSEIVAWQPRVDDMLRAGDETSYFPKSILSRLAIVAGANSLTCNIKIYLIVVACDLGSEFRI